MHTYTDMPMPPACRPVHKVPSLAALHRSEATVKALARAELINQRRLNEESPRPENELLVHSDSFIIPHVQMAQPNDEAAEESCWMDESVMPEDSVTGRGRMAQRKDQTSLCEREMAELRRLVSSDDRFGSALERTCQAVYECISNSNPSPILALLASLVWRSLCVAWELEPQAKLPKARLRSKIAGLEDGQQQIASNLEDARSKYLRELVALRDQVRNMDGRKFAAVQNVVYSEEPVMFYEPLKYVSEQTQQHVAEIVEEKLKLLVARLQEVPYEPLPKQPGKEKEEDGKVEDGFDKDMEGERRKMSKANAEATRRVKLQFERHTAEAEAAKREAEDAAGQLAKQCEESQTQVISLRGELESLQQQCSAAEAEISSLMTAAREEWEDLSTIDASLALPPPPDVRDTTSLSNGSGAGGGVDDFSARVREPVQYVVEMLGEQKQIRRQNTAKLEMAALELEKMKLEVPEPQATGHIVAEVSAASTAAEVSAKAAAECEAGLRQALDEQEEARKVAEERANAREKEQVVLRSEIERLQATQNPGAMSVESLSAKDEELATAQETIEQLKDEVERLRALIDELSGGEGQAREKLKAVGLVWRTPTQKVFDRLWQDSVDRQERRKSLIASVAQARDDHALEIFKSSLTPFTDYEVPSINATFDEFEENTSFSSFIVKSQSVGWLVDRSRSFLEPSLRSVMSGAEDDETAAAALAWQAGSRSSAQRSLSPQSSSACAPAPSDAVTASIPHPRVSSPIRSHSSNPGHGVTGRSARNGSPVRGTSPDAVCDKLDFSSFVAALGVECRRDIPTVRAPPAEALRPHVRPASPSSSGSRPNSAQRLHRAKATITARPRSAALPAIQRLHRPPSEAALFKEGQRLLAASSHPTAQLGRSSSAPGIRAARGSHRPQSGRHP